jgi:hypothetical protein
VTSSAARERLWDKEAARAQALGWGPYPRCDLCHCPIGPGQDWDISHGAVPAAFQGDPTGIAHRRCNRDDGAKYVTPMVAKAKRQSRKHKGCVLTSAPLPFGRKTNRSKKLSGEVVPRMTQGEKLRQTLAKRRIEP